MHPKYEALLEFFKDYRRVGVSMSGGTCSNLVAIAAAEALGPKNVNGINLVSEFLHGQIMNPVYGCARSWVCGCIAHLYLCLIISL